MKEIDPEMSLSLSMMCVKGISMMEKNLEEEEEEEEEEEVGSLELGPIYTEKTPSTYTHRETRDRDRDRDRETERY